MHEWYTILEAAEIYSVSPSTVRRWVENGLVRTRWDHLSRITLVLISDLETTI